MRKLPDSHFSYFLLPQRILLQLVWFVMENRWKYKRDENLATYLRHFSCHASREVFPKPTTLNEMLKYFNQTQWKQIKLKFKQEVKRFFLLLTCQVLKVQGSVFLCQHLAAETPQSREETFPPHRHYSLFLKCRQLSSTLHHAYKQSPCPSESQSEAATFVLLWYIATNLYRAPQERSPPPTSSFPLD